MPTDASPLARKLKLLAASRPAIVGGDPELAAGLGAAAGRHLPTEMWLGLVSIDATWSAFSLRHYRAGEARQTFR